MIRVDAMIRWLRRLLTWRSRRRWAAEFARLLATAETRYIGHPEIFRFSRGDMMVAPLNPAPRPGDEALCVLAIDYAAGTLKLTKAL